MNKNAIINITIQMKTNKPKHNKSKQNPHSTQCQPNHRLGMTVPSLPSILFQGRNHVLSDLFCLLHSNYHMLSTEKVLHK
jgi:hypothetical protein